MHPVRLQRVRATFAQIEPCGPAFIARALEGIRGVVPDVDQLLAGHDAGEVNARVWCAFRKVVIGIGTFRSIEKALVALGVPGYRLRSRGFGEARPVASNDTAEGRQMNRRVELVFAPEEGDALLN